MEGIIEEEEEDEEGSESVNKRKKADDMEVGVSLCSWNDVVENGSECVGVRKGRLHCSLCPPLDTSGSKDLS